jgi:hypothetical protein
MVMAATSRNQNDAAQSQPRPDVPDHLHSSPLMMPHPRLHSTVCLNQRRINGFRIEGRPGCWFLQSVLRGAQGRIETRVKRIGADLPVRLFKPVLRPKQDKTSKRIVWTLRAVRLCC